jgi:hypothetical protein
MRGTGILPVFLCLEARAMRGTGILPVFLCLEARAMRGTGILPVILCLEARAMRGMGILPVILCLEARAMRGTGILPVILCLEARAMRGTGILPVILCLEARAMRGMGILPMMILIHHGLEGRATAHPSPVYEFRRTRVVQNIMNRPFEIVCVANQMIKGIRLPEHALAPQRLVDLVARKALPRVQDLWQFLAWPWPYHNVNMVGHHAPGNQVIPFSIKVRQCVAHNPGGPFVLEFAGAAPGVEVFLHLFRMQIAQAPQF